MALPATFLSLKERYSQYRGELQNGSITGVNSDEISLMENHINEEIKELAGLHPPLLNGEWHIRMQTAVTMTASAGTPSVTGTKDLPILVDTASNLKTKHKFRMVENGQYRRRVLGVSGTTVDIDQGLIQTATTAQTWIAYKVDYPLAHNAGDMIEIFYEDGELPIELSRSRGEFDVITKRKYESDRPRFACINYFNGRKYADYKFRETAVTVTNGSNILSVSNTLDYEMGDVLTLTSSASTVSLHTLIGVSNTTVGNVYIDRSYEGVTGNVTLECNPAKYTEYITFWFWPTGEKDIIIRGWIKPQDLVYATDISIFPAEYDNAIVIGALLRDKLALETVSNEWIAYYEKVKRRLMSKRNAKIDDIFVPRGLNSTGFSNADYPNFTGLTSAGP